MNRSLFRIWFILFFVLFTYSINAKAEPTGPKIYIEQPVFDAKDIKSAEYLEHAYKVANKGDAILEITDVKPGWGCAVSSFDKTILPGREGKITLKVKIQGHVGGIEKTARVYSNDPQSNIEILTLKANIRQSVQALPSSLMFQVQEGVVQTLSVDVISSEPKPLDIKPADFNLTDKLTYRIEEVQKGKLFRIYFTNVPDAAGSFNGFLQLTTNYDDTPEIRISLNGVFRKNTGINDKK